MAEQGNQNPSPEGEFHDASLECWEAAVTHAERAAWFLNEAEELYVAAQEAALDHRVMAMAYLSAGGFGNDRASFEELGLPYDEHSRPDEGF